MARRRLDAGEIARKSSRNNTLGRLWRAVGGLWGHRVRPDFSRMEGLESRQLLSSGTVVISEIMYHPGRGELGDAGYIQEDPALEYIELYNQGPAAVNLNGWHFSQGVDYTFPDVTMDVGSYLVVAADVNAFKAKYPGVNNVVGGWTGKLSNSGEDIELENNVGDRDDFVSYTNQGEWAQRRIGEIYPGQPSWWRGWDWTTGADGGLKSLELINVNAPNEYGQNWAASIPDGGTPGQPNSVAAADIAPIIDKVKHSPAIPKSTDNVTVTAKLIDELPTGTNATLRWRTDGSTTFNSVQMYDDGQHGDGIANDGTWGATIPAQANRTIVEFYVQANDATGHVRTWPAPSDAQGTQGTNALYQVDDTVYTGDQPIYRVIVPAAEWTAWSNLTQPNNLGRYSNAAMNGTFIAVDSTGTEVRYNVGVRNRGAGTRASIPHNLRVDVPNDKPFEGLSSIDFNTQFVESQVAGNAIFLAAGLPSHYGAAIQMRVNGQNLALSGSPQYGSYFRVEPYNSEWTANHMPDDADGNIYKGTWYLDNASLSNGGANLAYLGANPALYQQLYSANGPSSSTGAYSKQTNAAENDWSDLINMINILNNAPTATYVQDVSQVINIDEWLRYFAVNSLIGNGETTLGTGAGDDYSMIAGKVDTRFQLLNHDMDTVLGRGGGADVNRSIWYAADHIAALGKFMRTPEIAERYYAILTELINTTFSPGQINPMLDNLLGGWVPQSDIDAMKGAAADRVASVLKQIPTGLTVTNPTTTVTAPTVSLTGLSDAISTRSVRVNGVPATWSAWEGKWTANNVSLVPGINRIVIQALDASGNEIERTAVDVLYDVAAKPAPTFGAGVTQLTWTAAGGPYLVSSNYTVAAGQTLTIEPGTSVYFASGVSMTINGRLVAQGTDARRIRFTRQPNTTGGWGGLAFSNTRADNVLAYADIEWATSGSQVIDSHGSRLLIDHCTFLNNDNQTFDIWDPQFTLRNSVLGAVGSHYTMKVERMPVDGWFIVDKNLFDVNGADADIMHLNGVSRKGGPIAQVTNNFFLGAGDDIIDDNETDTYIAGNFLGKCNLGGNGRSAGAAITTGPYVYTFPQSSSASDTSSLNFTSSYNLTSQRLTVIGNVFFESETGLMVKTDAWASLYNNAFIGLFDGAVSFDEINRALTWQGGDCFPGRGADVHNSIFINNGYYNANNQWIDRTFEYVDNVAVDPLMPNDYRNPASPGKPQLIVENSIVPAKWVGYGTGNITADPRFVYIPPSRTNFSTNQPRFWTGYNGFDSSPYVPAGQAPDVHLLPGSAAIGTGEAGTDMGIYAPNGAWVTGAPTSPTYRSDATLDVSGASLYGYKYRVLKDGVEIQPWSEEKAKTQWATAVSRNGMTVTLTVPSHGYSNGDVVEIMGIDAPTWNGKFTIFNVTPNTFDYTITQASNRLFPADNHLDITVRRPEQINLSGLSDGTYTVEVIKKDPALPGTTLYGVQPWQSTANPTRVSWTVNTALAPHVRLNEVLAHNVSIAHNGTAPDMIELYNDGGDTADLSGMIITDDPANPLGHRFTFPAGTTLTKGAYLTLYADNLVVPGEFHLGFNLAGEGDTVALLNPDGTTADSVTYGVQIPDMSIGRNAAGNWTLNTPTLGEANVSVQLGDASSVKVNEWLAAENVLFENDFVELYNTGALPVDLGGYYFTDNPVDMAHMAQFAPAMAAGYKLPPLSFIAAGGYRSFTADGDIAQGGDHVNFSLDHVHGLIALMDPGFRLVDQVVYDPQKLDVSEGRNPGADGTFSSETIPTPGIENTGVTRIIGGTVSTASIFDIASGTQKWSWWDKGSLPSGAWTTPGYTETGWSTNGTAVFWNKASDTYPEAKRTQVAVQTTGNVGKPFQTYYFRTHFTFTGDATRAVSIDLRTILDDGAVIYLNGQEALRIAMDPGTVSYTTLANRTVGTATYESYSIDLSKLPAGTLHQGDNVLAVEVHQCVNQSGSSTSSDIVWGTTLSVKSADTTLKRVDVPANITNLMNQLRITEVMYDPIGGNTYEYIELKNNGSTAVDLTGVRLGGGVDFVFPQKMVDGVAEPYMLGPGEYVVVASDAAAFTSRYGSAINLAGQYSGHLNGKGENIVLRLPDPWEAAMLRFAYKPSWYPSTDGNGNSLVVIDASAPQASWSNKSSWRASIQAGGSPGAVDQGTAAGAVVINEVMPYTSEMTKGQWIEIRNTTSEPFDISNWYVSDDLANLTKFRIPANTIIPEGGFYTLSENADFNNPGNSGCLTAFTLKATGGGVYLTSSNPDGSAGDYRESVAYGAAELNVSFGQYQKSNGQSEFVAMSESTFGDVNAYPKIGPVIITEVMYHPPAGGDEFIELYNTSDGDVAMADAAGNGWKIDGVGFAFAGGDVIPAHQYALVVAMLPADFRVKYHVPAGVKIFGPYLGSLDNGGEYLSLTKPGVAQAGSLLPAEVLVDAVDYNDVAPWPTSPDGDGPSLVRIDPTKYGNDVVNWEADGYGGTPGRSNNGDSTPPTASITAVDPDPHAGGVDSISIVFSEPVMGFDISDLSLSRGSSGNLLGSGQSLTTSDGGTSWVLSGLRGLSFVAGNYTLTLSAGGISDLAGNALASGATESFAVSTTSLSGTSGSDDWTLSVDESNLLISESHSGAAPTVLFTVPLNEISSLTLNGLDGNDSVTINSALPFAPQFNGGPGSNTLTISAGNYSFGYDLGAASEHLWLSLSGSTIASFDASQHLQNLAIADSARANLLGGKRLIRTSGLSLGGNGALDLSDGTLIVQSDEQHRQAMADTIAQAIAGSRNASPLWSGAGITSSAAAGNSLLGLAAILNMDSKGAAIRTQMDGEAVDTSSILVKCSFNGDANVDGKLDASDYFLIDKGFLSKTSADPLGGYRNGDFNYDGKIDASDYFLIDKAFLSQASSSAAAPLASSAAPKPVQVARSKVYHRKPAHGRPQGRNSGR